jgi:hypothetical protein
LAELGFDSSYSGQGAPVVGMGRPSNHSRPAQVDTTRGVRPRV